VIGIPSESPIGIVGIRTLVRELSKHLFYARDRLEFGRPVADALTVAQLLDKYAEILSMYQDSALVWQLEISNRRHAPKLELIATEYGARGAIQKDADGFRVVNFEEIQRKIWTKATSTHEQYLGHVFGAVPLPSSGSSK
jgi:hypothetical protein